MPTPSGFIKIPASLTIGLEYISTLQPFKRTLVAWVGGAIVHRIGHAGGALSHKMRDHAAFGNWPDRRDGHWRILR